MIRQDRRTREPRCLGSLPCRLLSRPVPLFAPGKPPGKGEELLALLFPHLAGLRVDRVEDNGDAVVISASCRAASACCLRCGQASSRVHGGYSRVVADGAAGGRC